MSAASEWAPAGVRVNCVAPGGIESRGFDTYPPEAQHVVLDFPKTIPLQGYGNVAEVSAAIVYLLSRPRPTSRAAACAWTAARRTRDTAGTRRPHDRSEPFEALPLQERPLLLRASEPSESP